MADSTAKKAAAKKAAPAKKAAATNGPRFRRVSTSPSKAAEWLKNNKANRNLRDMKIEQYARDMDNGDWDDTVGQIRFDHDGNLIDGQHRLSAQVKSGATLTWSVVEDAAPESQFVVDTGITRNIGDVLHFKGEVDASLLGAVARIVAHIKQNGFTKQRFTLSHEELLHTIEEEPHLRRSVEMARTTRGGMTPIAPSVLGAAHWLIMKHNTMAEADAFLVRMTQLSGEREGSPILALSRRANEIKRMQMRVAPRDLLALVIKAWNYDAEYKTVHKLAVYPKSGEYKLPEVKERKVPVRDGDEEEADTQVG